VDTKISGSDIAKKRDSLSRSLLHGDWASRPSGEQFNLGAGNCGRLGINNFDGEVGSKSRKGQKSHGQKPQVEPHHSSFISRKGLVLSVRAGLLARE
jgi:hypothetical protein